MNSSQLDGGLDELHLAEKNMRLHLGSEAHRRYHGRQPDPIRCVRCERTIRRLLAALDASREKTGLVLVGDWIAEDVGRCTCGVHPYGHEPECGLNPIRRVDDATRARIEAAADDAEAQRLMGAILVEESYRALPSFVAAVEERERPARPL